MGTVVSLTADSPQCPEETVEKAFLEAFTEIARLERLLSVWLPDSPVSRYRRGEVAEGELPAEVVTVLRHCARAKALTGGWFDASCLPGGFDPTGLAKGWILEQACALLAELDVGGVIVNGGGDIATFGEPRGGGRRRVGVRHPWRSDSFACVVSLNSGEAVATSGTYERGAHLIDPFTPEGTEPAMAAVSATVVAASLTTADAVATALATAGEEGRDLFAKLEAAECESYLVLQDGRELATSRFPFAPGSPFPEDRAGR